MRYCDELRDDVLGAIKKTIPLYTFDQYKNYTATDKSNWQEYLFQRLRDYLGHEDGYVFFEIVDGLIYLVGCEVPQWDKDHFGFKMAKINWLICPKNKNACTIMGKLLDDCISHLRDSGVKFVSAHSSGEDLLGLHLLEDTGFRYYQTTVYSIAECTNLPYKADLAVRLWQEADLPAVIEIAKHNQYPHGHFYSDSRFDRTTVDSMYEKWIRTSWNNKEPIAVIEKDGRLAGYFAFVMDEALSDAIGYRYGRMTSLAMDASTRSRGLGSSLFKSVIALISDFGGQHVASEYPLRNYTSGGLHAKNMFYTVHEKVLLHLWL